MSQITEHLRIKPNQGIRSSGLHALYLGLLSMLFFGLLGGLYFGLLHGLLHGLRGGLVFGLLLGLSSGLVYGLLYGLLYGGGIAYLQHYLLRYLLWRKGAMPWHYVRFLEDASERILLQKVGGGYRFIHPLFLDYFASQPTKISSGSTQEAPPSPTSSSSPLS